MENSTVGRAVPAHHDFISGKGHESQIIDIKQFLDSKGREQVPPLVVNPKVSPQAQETAETTHMVATNKPTSLGARISSFFGALLDWFMSFFSSEKEEEVTESTLLIPETKPKKVEKKEKVKQPPPSIQLGRSSSASFRSEMSSTLGQSEGMEVGKLPKKLEAQRKAKIEQKLEKLTLEILPPLIQKIREGNVIDQAISFLPFTSDKVSESDITLALMTGKKPDGWSEELYQEIQSREGFQKAQSVLHTMGKLRAQIETPSQEDVKAQQEIMVEHFSALPPFEAMNKEGFDYTLMIQGNEIKQGSKVEMKYGLPRNGQRQMRQWMDSVRAMTGRETIELNAQDPVVQAQVFLIESNRDLPLTLSTKEEITLNERSETLVPVKGTHQVVIDTDAQGAFIQSTRQFERRDSEGKVLQLLQWEETLRLGDDGTIHRNVT